MQDIVREGDVGEKSILLVEDDAVVRDLIKSALERHYHVLEAGNYSEAIDLLMKRLDLALVDYALPDRDGLEVLKAIRGVKPHLPVILMTAYSTENLTAKALKAGVTDYMTKPLSFSYLKGKLSEILDGEAKGLFLEDIESREVFTIDCIAAFVEENFMKDLDRDQLAEKACMSRHRFSRMFNRRMGRSFPYYLNSVRIGKAAELLRNPDLSISEIANLVGYKSLTQFERVFREAYGVPPKEYRKIGRKAHTLI